MFSSFREPNGMLPLILGVTGHRDLRPEDLPGLRLQVKKVFDEIHSQWAEKGESGAPLYLLSGMAAGADQLAAEVALEAGIKVIAVLPMPLSEYEADFPSDEERQHLKTLLQQASGTITLPSLGGAREAQYEAVGTYISRQSSLLLALWDGTHVDKIGGTSHVVRMKLYGADSNADGPLHSLELSPPGPVCHIVTPRQSSPTPPSSSIRVLGLEGESGELKSSALEGNPRIAASLGGMREFNADWKRLKTRLGAQAEAAAKGFLPTPPQSEDEEYLRSYYGVADTLAIYFQRLSNRFVNWYFGLLLFAGVLLEGGYYYFPAGDKVEPFEITYGALMLVLGTLYWFSKKKDFQNRYLDYRALAEALRVQLFWRLAGVKDSVADHYLAHQVGDMGWVCKALEAIHLPLLPPTSSDFGALREYWVKDQLKFFKSSVRKNARMAAKVNKAGGVALGLSLVWVGLRIVSADWFTKVLVKENPGVSLPEELPWHEVVRMLGDHLLQPHFFSYLISIFCVVFAGTSAIAFVLFGYDKFRGFSEHSKRHLAMIPIYEMATRALARPLSDESARQVVLQLGREALA
ncbi:MAG TPA: hypothetical protein VJ873_08510, partial [bacterium]|nr:hypothetical protein [bacterium]